MSRSRNHYITVASGMSGYFAVERAEYEDMGWCEDNVQTGIGRYNSFEAAREEGLEWAEAERLPFK